MPFKHYIQKLEGKLNLPERKQGLVRYKNSAGNYRYGVRVEGVQDTTFGETQVWAWWADTPEEALALYDKGVAEDLLYTWGRGRLTWTASRAVEEYADAI